MTLEILLKGAVLVLIMIAYRLAKRAIMARWKKKRHGRKPLKVQR